MTENENGEVRRLPERAHGPDCSCTRCVGFLPANRHAVRHGGYSLQLGGRVAEIADAVRESASGFERGIDDHTVHLYSLSLSRIEVGRAALEEADARGERLEALEQSLRQWTGVARRLGNDLGLSASARSRIMRDSGLARSVFLERAVAELEAHIRETEGEGG